MILNLQESPWYQQAVFFYLHFQYFGAFFTWFLAVFLKNTSIQITKQHVFFIGISLIGLYAHSLDYNFNHWVIQVIGGASSILLLYVFLNFFPSIKTVKKCYQNMYGILMIVAICNLIGSFPTIVSLIQTNHSLLIAWLHFLFLGLFVPFIWIECPIKISLGTWITYSLFIFISETLLLFPSKAYQLLNIPITWLLLIAYLGVFMCISIIHLKFLFIKLKK